MGFFDHRLSDMQNARIFAFGKCYATHHGTRGLEHGAHRERGSVNQGFKLLLVRVKIQRPGRSARLHSRLGDSMCNPWQQPRVERFRNQVFRTEIQAFAPVGDFHLRRRRRPRQLGDRLDASNLHLVVEFSRADIKRSSEDERETEHIVDLVRIIRSPGRNERVGSCFVCFFRHDFGHWIRQREYDRPARHFRYIFFGQQVGPRQA